MFKSIVVFCEQDFGAFSALRCRNEGDKSAVEGVDRIDFVHSQTANPGRNLVQILISD